MVRQVFLAAVMLSRDPGCGVDGPEKDINAPCTRDSDCRSGLSCAGGVCTGPDAGSDAPSDGGDAG